MIWDPDRPVPRPANLSARGGLRVVHDYHRAQDAPEPVRSWWGLFVLLAVIVFVVGYAMGAGWVGR